MRASHLLAALPLVLCAPSALAQAAPWARQPPERAQPQAAPAGAPAGAPGQRLERPVTWALELGGDFGSTTLFSVTFPNGDTRRVKANQGGWISGGVTMLPLLDGALRTRLTLGLKYAGIQASDGSLYFLAFPLELLETADVGPVRFGAGLYTLLGPRIRGTGAAAGLIDTDLDTSFGFTARAEYVWRGRGASLGFGPRVLVQRLSANGRSVDATAFGFLLSFSGV